MKKVDIDDLEIKIEEEEVNTGISYGVAKGGLIDIYFSIVRVLDEKCVHFDTPSVLEMYGISEDELEKEILEIYDRG